MARPGRTIRRRLAAISRNAAGAGFSMSMTRPIVAICARGRDRAGPARPGNGGPGAASVAAEQPPARLLEALKIGQGVVIGFNAAKSHRIVDMRENHILRPELIGLVGPLRELLGGLLQPRRTAEVQMTVVDQGVDVSLKGVEPDGLAAMETLTAFCESQRLARLSMDQGFGAETIYEPKLGHGQPVRHSRRLSGRRLSSGDRRRRGGVNRRCPLKPWATWRIADLFAGLGTFALATKASYAAEASPTPLRH